MQLIDNPYKSLTLLLKLIIFKINEYFSKSGNGFSQYNTNHKNLRISESKVFDNIESIRKESLNCKTIISVADFGSTGHINCKVSQSISQITKRSSVQSSIGRLLFRIVRHHKPQTVLELGTSLGISSLYIAYALNSGQLITLEGCPEKSKIALENFKKLNLTNITMISGQFDSTLPQLFSDDKSIDMVFIDGNHKYENTLHYINLLLSEIKNSFFIAMHDINRSKGMEKAWCHVKNYPDVSVIAENFFFGLVRVNNS